MKVPIQVGCVVHDLAKLRMLELYFDCIDKYIDRSSSPYLQMDTDSSYIAFSGDNFEDLIKPELKEHYFQNNCKWFPRNDRDHKDVCVNRGFRIIDNYMIT
jgi:hypothetical protein